MGDRVTLVLCLLFGGVVAKYSMVVDVTHEWKLNFGWEVVCSWQLFANDSLQSVRLYKSEQQFLIYRPEVEGPSRSVLFSLPTEELQVDCSEDDKEGVTGKCVMTLEMLQPETKDFSYTCEVSGERPLFRFESKTINVEALVRPTDAVVNTVIGKDQPSERVSVNCTSSGLPAPTLVWTIGDQKIPADFSDSRWNFSSKLYDVWSSLSYTPDGVSHAICTPETVRGGRRVRGLSAQYSDAELVRGGTTFYACLLLILALSR